MKKAALYLLLITLFSKILGFTREIVLSHMYGASNISDAYIVSTTVPTFIFSFLGVAIATSYIPIYSTIENEKGIQSANIFTNTLVHFVILICTLLIIVAFVFTTPIVKLFASGFDKKTLSLAVLFTKISIFSIYFIGLIYVFNSYLQIKGKFVIPACIGFLFNFVIITSIILSDFFNILMLPIGYVLSYILQFLFLLPFLRKHKYKYKYSFIIDKDTSYYMKRIFYLSLPGIFGASVNEINSIVDRTIASRISVGGISALNYAINLNSFIQGLFVLTITTVMYPIISKMVVESDVDGVKKSLNKAINSITLLVIPITIGSMIFSEPLINFLFGRGAFDSKALSMTSEALFFYSIGMIGFSLRELLSRVFYAFQDTKTPMINAAIAIFMNIVLSIILSRYLEIGGLALATSISAIFCTLLLFINLRNKIGSFEIRNIIISFVKVLCASLLMGMISRFFYYALLNNINDNLCLVLSVCIGAITYLVIIYFMRIKEINIIVNVIKKKLFSSFNVL
ncbi:putative membrane protein, MviN family [Anoxybacillus flavithermus TNO-09.006]|uniref:murein biosynthesis integral membrane protein MurJ n=1 Tax=Anoxybacillus flavithermus TaxID=33934 RepID=UPI0002A710EE|nr:murein biosynthesis integral membrane protein MurJ [Anoxybacillus flavithermus]ELK20661.1 putative membrane protein, MviN family [Anoxybacillus flavithermus TNO-09.006]